MTMKNKISYGIGLAICLALPFTTACNKPDSAGSESGESQYIRFAGPLQTKATDPLESEDIVEVRDWYNGESYLIEDSIRDSSSFWVYESHEKYKWLNGTHVLFGWLKNSNAGTSTAFFGPGFGASGTTLTIPAKTMNSSTRQYDFLYSNVVSRSTAENDYSEVPLIFKHLFAQVAVSFKVSDKAANTELPINLKRVYLKNTFKNQRSATIDFSTAGDATVTPSSGAADGYFKTPVDFNIADYGKASTPIDVLSQVQSTDKLFYFVWPTPEADLKNVIEVEYELGGDDRTSTLSFPEGTSWEGGHKYQYTISYMGGILKVNETVLPWDYEASTGLKVEDQSAVATWMGWDASTCAVSGSNVNFLEDGDGNLMKAHGMFKIYAPTACTYTVSLTGADAAHFTLENNTGEIGDSGSAIVPGATIDFYVSAVDRPASGTYTAGLSFSVSVSGPRSYSLDSELQRDGLFNLTIPAL